MTGLTGDLDFRFFAAARADVHRYAADIVADHFALPGTRMLRKEDPCFLIGRGRLVDDLTLPNQAHGAVLRSPHAHARIRSIDKAAALALPGVIAVITGEDAAKETGPLPTRVISPKTPLG